MNTSATSASSSGAEFDFLFKLLLIGNSGVGKSCMLLRYSENSFTTNFFNTIGVDFKIKSIVLDAKNVKLQIWDTAGQERFRTITSSYYRGAQGILIVYDVTDRDSFESVKNWMTEVDKYAQDHVIRVLIGNKCDMMENRQVTTEEGQELARHYNISFFETSAKSANNVDMAFQGIARSIMEKMLSAPSKNDSKFDNKKKITAGVSSDNNVQKNSCC